MKIFILFSLIMITSTSYGQNGQVQKDNLPTKSKILYVLISDNKDPIATKNLIINTNDIDSLYEMPFDKCIEMRKLMKVSTIWVLKPKKNIIIFTLNDIFDIYNIQNKERNLSVYIDGSRIYNPETIVVDRNEIKIVKVSKNFDGMRIISIITFHPLVKERKVNDGITIH